MGLRSDLKSVINEQMLNEQPWVDIMNDDETFWDFCAEEGWKTANWLQQLIDLYTKNEMHSGNPVKNAVEVIKLTDDQVKTATQQMLRDPWFIKRVKEDIKNLSSEKLTELRFVLPLELRDAIFNQ